MFLFLYIYYSLFILIFNCLNCNIYFQFYFENLEKLFFCIWRRFLWLRNMNVLNLKKL